MAIHPSDLSVVKNTLWAGETVMLTATQRRLGPGMELINPTTIICTDKRLIIVNRATLGLRKDIETIPYGKVSSVRLENGFVSASVFMRIEGYSSPGEQGFIKKGEQEGEVDGLHKGDAKALADFMDKMITSAGMGMQGNYGQAANPQAFAPSGQQRQGQGRAQGASGQISSAVPNGSFCPNCGTKNSASASYCVKCGNLLANR